MVSTPLHRCVVRTTRRLREVSTPHRWSAKSTGEATYTAAAAGTVAVSLARHAAAGDAGLHGPLDGTAAKVEGRFDADVALIIAGRETYIVAFGSAVIDADEAFTEMLIVKVFVVAKVLIAAKLLIIVAEALGVAEVLIIAKVLVVAEVFIVKELVAEGAIAKVSILVEALVAEGLDTATAEAIAEAPRGKPSATAEVHSDGEARPTGGGPIWPPRSSHRRGRAPRA